MFSASLEGVYVDLCFVCSMFISDVGLAVLLVLAGVCGLPAVCSLSQCRQYGGRISYTPCALHSLELLKMKNDDESDLNVNECVMNDVECKMIVNVNVKNEAFYKYRNIIHVTVNDSNRIGLN